MQFSKLILAAATFVAVNAVKFTDPTFAGITVGVPFDITWTDASGPVTLTLKNGAPGNLQTVTVIAQGLTGTSFTWTPPATLPADTYAIQIGDSTSVPNYSTQFQLVGGAAMSISSSLSSASSSIASSVSSALASITSGSSSTSSSAASKTSSSASSNSSSSSSKSSASLASKTSSTTSNTGTSTPAPSAGAAAGLASPLAMVFLAFAAFVTLN